MAEPFSVRLVGLPADDAARLTAEASGAAWSAAGF
jgi:hypothetical protein